MHRRKPPRGRCEPTGRTWAPALIAALCVATAAVAGCGDSSEGRAGAERLTVAAAASLSEAFDAYAEASPGEERFSFAGSDELAAQIREGASVDVFASAAPVYPRRLAAAGLVGEPVIFARNRLVVAVEPGSDIDSLAGLAAPGIDIVLGAEGVPAGDYARQAVRRLEPRIRDGILANVRSEEPDVKGVVGKVAQGAADAGFAYATDVAAAEDRLRAIELPANAAPEVEYAIAVGARADQPAQAQRFVDGLLDGAGSRALTEAGFEPPR